MSYITSKNHYIQVQGNKIAYRELAQGKSKRPLVLLTHLTATLDNWDPLLLDLLAEERHILVMDLPGVGASQGKIGKTIPDMAEQAVAIIAALGYEQIDLLGLSMGGMIAQEIVRHYPALVNHLILAGTGPRGGFEMDKVSRKTYKYIYRGIRHHVDPKRYIFYNHDEAGRLEAEKVLGRMAQRRAEDTDDKITLSAMRQQLRAIKRWGKAPSDDLSYISQPTLIVNGDQDMQVPTENSYDLHHKIAGSKLIIYPDAGHGSIFQNAEAFSQALHAFLN